MSKQDDTKQLWKLCFGDSDDFIHFYFDAKYSDQNTFAIYESDKMVSVLQAIPYQIHTLGQTFDAAYISGACTHPEYRNKGYMSRLLQQTIQTLYERNVPLTFLIPQEKWLCKYYAQFGFSLDLYRSEMVCATRSFSNEYEVLPVHKNSYENVLNSYRKYTVKTNCVLHDSTDFLNNLIEVKLSGGEILAISNEDEIQAFALLREATLEIFGDMKYTDSFCAFCNRKGIPYRTILTQNSGKKVPHGMIRIVCTEPILEAFTKINSQQFPNISLRDNEIAANNKTITLSNSTKTLNDSEKQMTINDLTSMVFDESIFVNCMLE